MGRRVQWKDLIRAAEKHPLLQSFRAGGYGPCEESMGNPAKLAHSLKALWHKTGNVGSLNGGILKPRMMESRFPATHQK
jgi:hypothetical protein